MFAIWARHFLVVEHLQVFDEANTCVSRVDNVIHESTLCSALLGGSHKTASWLAILALQAGHAPLYTYKRVGKLGSVLGSVLLNIFSPEDDFYGTLGTHDGYLGGWPPALMPTKWGWHQTTFQSS